jgi:nucleolar protein 6
MQKEEAAKLEKANNKTQPQQQKQEQRDEDSIHPSRRARVPFARG